MGAATAVFIILFQPGPLWLVIALVMVVMAVYALLFTKKEEADADDRKGGA